MKVPSASEAEIAVAEEIDRRRLATVGQAVIERCAFTACYRFIGLPPEARDEDEFDRIVSDVVTTLGLPAREGGEDEPSTATHNRQ